MRRDDTTEGYILVAVLSVMLVLAGLIASSSLVAQSALRGARADMDAAALDGLLHGGLEMTAYQLFTLDLPSSLVSGRPLRFGTGSVVPRITDEGGKIDVNAADPAVLTGAFRAAELDAGRAAELLSRVVTLRGATGPNASALTPPDLMAAGAAPSASQPAPPAVTPASPATGAVPSQPRRTGFRSVADFIAFADVDREQATTLSGMLTVANPDGKVNVMTASRRILMALPDMSDATVDALIADRQAGADVGRIKGALDRQQAFVKFEPGPCYRLDLDAKNASGHKASARAVIAASKTPGDPFYVLAWE